MKFHSLSLVLLALCLFDCQGADAEDKGQAEQKNRNFQKYAQQATSVYAYNREEAIRKSTKRYSYNGSPSEEPRADDFQKAEQAFQDAKDQNSRKKRNISPISFLNPQLERAVSSKNSGAKI